MKKGLIISIILCLLPALPPAGAQDYSAPEIQLSTEKVRGSDGKVYYSHVVREKQTLEAICQAYGVSEESVILANKTSVQKGRELKKNSIILIPLDAVGTAPPAEAKPQDEPDDDETAYIIHIVRWFENLRDISKKYGVPAEVIAEINELKKNKVKTRQRLRIPADYQKYLENKLGVKKELGVTEEIAEVPEEKTPEATAPVVFTKKNSVNAVLLLHLGDRNSDNNLDFYSGALMAAREIGERGTGVDLHVIDLSAETLSADVASRIHRADVVIGPIQPSQISTISKSTGDASTFVSPLDPRGAALADTTFNIVQAPSAAKFQYADMADWIIGDRRGGDNIVVISEKGARQSEGMAIFNEKLAGMGIITRNFSYTILEGRDILESFGRVFSAEGTNRVVILSESEAFTNDVVRNLNVLIHNKYSIVLYSTSRIRSFDTIDAENLHNVNLHVSMSYFINYNSPEVRKFLAGYRALFNTEPNQFAFQGYDVTTYFLKACAEYGENWREGILRSGRSAGLQSSFKFEKGSSDNGGLLNSAVRRAEYCSDYSVKEISR